MQDMFPRDNQEVRFSFTHMSADGEVTERHRRADVCVGETVIEYQHSRITREEVGERNSDYGNKAGKCVIWVIDCTQNINKPKCISQRGEAEDDVWILEFEKKWHVEAMSDCPILFADFGDRIFRVPVQSVRYRMVAVFGSIPKGPEFSKHITSPELDTDLDLIVPAQSCLTVAQDPHGSGKTYGLTMMIIRTDLEEYRRYDQYGAFVIVTKAHSAKEVVYSEFMERLRDSACVIVEEKRVCKKYVVKFTRPSGSLVLCIFGTADSLMWNLTENRKQAADPFIGLVQTIHEHGPTKLKGPKGRMNYASEQPPINKGTLLITDEATMLPEAYADAFATLMHMCHVDVHLAGDVQQSTFYEDNLLTKVMREYNKVTSNSLGSPDPPRLPSFPDSKVVIHPGNRVRRFNQHLVDFRNAIMTKFHTNPSHNLNIRVPVAAGDVVHTRGDFSIHALGYTGPGADPETIEDAVDEILDRIKQDVEDFGILPNDLLIVTPFVSNNPLMDQLRTAVEELWAQKFSDPAYVDRVRGLRDFGETFQLVEEAKEVPEPRETPKGLPWLCVLHRSEEGKPIDTTESKYGTRIVSIHASQGDGRRFVYLVGMTQKALCRFSGGKINLKYESLMNVAVSRMKEVVRVYLEKTYDDVWERFTPIMPDELKGAVPPGIDTKVRFLLSECTDITPGLFDAAKDCFGGSLSGVDEQNPRPLVDYAHHMVRMQTVHSIFHAKVLAHQAKDGPDYSEQLFVVFNHVAHWPVRALGSQEYYQTLKRVDRGLHCIPVLYYNTGASVYGAIHKRIMHLLGEVQEDIRGWLRGNGIDENAFLQPEKAVVMQYAVGCVTMGKRGGVKMDTVYDVVNCYMHMTEEKPGKLHPHYEELKNAKMLFEQVIAWGNCEAWSWKINRTIKLGKISGGKLPHFEVKGHIDHLYLNDTHAMPVILVPSMDEISMARQCEQALLHTLVCLQPEKESFEDGKGKPTWEYINGKRITVCFVPIKASRPVFVDMTRVVEDNISLIAEWVSGYIRGEAEAYHPQLIKVAEVSRNDFYTAFEKVEAAHKKNKCLLYVYYAFETATEGEGFEDLERHLNCRLKTHVQRFRGQLERR